MVSTSAGCIMGRRLRWEYVGGAVPGAIGLLLLAAALLKLHEFGVTPPSRAVSPAWFTVAVVVIDWALGAWLLCGYRRLMARRVAIATFAVYACYMCAFSTPAMGFTTKSRPMKVTTPARVVR